MTYNITTYWLIDIILHCQPPHFSGQIRSKQEAIPIKKQIPGGIGNFGITSKKARKEPTIMVPLFKTIDF